MTKAERETVIRWDEEEQTVHVWSASKMTWRKMERLGLPVLDETQRQRTEEISGRAYRLPLKEFKWGRKRPRTAAQDAAARKSLKFARMSPKLRASAKAKKAG
jgi:hypothetical protein